MRNTSELCHESHTPRIPPLIFWGLSPAPKQMNNSRTASFFSTWQKYRTINPIRFVAYRAQTCTAVRRLLDRPSVVSSLWHSKSTLVKKHRRGPFNLFYELLGFIKAFICPYHIESFLRKRWSVEDIERTGQRQQIPILHEYFHILHANLKHRSFLVWRLMWFVIIFAQSSFIDTKWRKSKKKIPISWHFRDGGEFLEKSVTLRNVYTQIEPTVWRS